jgi:hypothetical protein
MKVFVSYVIHENEKPEFHSEDCIIPDKVITLHTIGDLQRSMSAGLGTKVRILGITKLYR